MTVPSTIPLPAHPRILIVKLSAVGDVVHALPALNALRQHFPNAHIGWAVQRGPHNLLEGHPQIDELIVLPRRLKTPEKKWTLAELRKLLHGSGGWDVAIDFQGLTKSGVAACLSGAPQRIGLGNKWSRELNRIFMTQRVNAQSLPVIQMNLELLEPLMPVPAEAKALLHTQVEDEQFVDNWMTAHATSDRYLIVDPFAGWETKTWPQERWVEVIRRAQAEFGLISLIFFGPGEEHHAANLANAASIPACRPQIAPSTTLRQYVALLRRCARVFVGGDTGPMHIAAAAGIPCVALFGPSDSQRNAPTFTSARYTTLQDFNQPCAGTNARRCKFHQPGECMNTLTPDQVLEGLSTYAFTGRPGNHD